MNIQPFQQALAAVRPQPNSEWLVACSGGMDSCALLDCVLAHAADAPIRVLHIDHGLQSDSAATADWVSDHCRALGVNCLVVKVQVENQGKGEEEAAREARYSVFETELKSGGVLLLGHHLDDQVETVLLRLLRGAGPAGLAGIPVSRKLGKGALLRPLLSYSRAQLVDYAEERGLQWREDPSNTDMRFDRNYLRAEVLPLLEARWPGYRRSWANVARIQKAYSEQLEELASADLRAFDLRDEAFGVSLDIDPLKQLPLVRARNVLAVACREHGMTAPPRAQVEEVVNSLLMAREDAQPLVQWSGVQARRFAKRLYLLDRLPVVDDHYKTDLDCQPATRSMSAEMPGVGRLELTFRNSDAVPFTLQLRFREGGEKIQVDQQHRKSLTNWFQENAVPPWLRDRVPLLVYEGAVVAVADLWLSEQGRTLLSRVRLYWV